MSGLSKGGLAAGLTSLSVPFLTFFVSPVVAATLLLPLLCAIDVGVIIRYWKVVSWQLVYRLIPGALIGIICGSLVFEYVPQDLVKVIVATIALWFCGLYYLKDYLPTREVGFKTWLVILFGAISGFTSFISHSGGPPTRAYLLSQNLDKSTYVGTFGVFFGLVNYIKLFTYAAIGQFDKTMLMASLSLAPMVPIGLLLGFWIHTRISQQLFTKISYLLLLIAALKLLYDGFHSVLTFP